MPHQDQIPAVFISHAADILGDTNLGLSGAEIIKATSAYAVEHGINLPHSTQPFDAPNKRTALYQNLMAFPASMQYKIIFDLCDHKRIQEHNKEEAIKLKLKLITKYSHLDEGRTTSDINPKLIEETKHWLGSFPEAKNLYEAALQKHSLGSLKRNVLDDLRLALEKLLHALFQNNKSLENQIPALGQFVKGKGGSPEFANMFVKLVDYYSKYQNTYVKHDDAVIDQEVDFVFEITSSFMKHLVRLSYV